jgi:hypothetical protein
MKISLLDMRLFLALAGLCSFLTATASAFLVLQTPATAVRGVTSHQQSPTNLCAFLQQSSREEENDVNRFSQVISQAAVTAAAALVVLSATVMFASPAYADGATKTFKLPPIDYNDQNRCVLKSSSMGQANAARDKLVDLRECKIPDANARGFDLSGVLMYVLGDQFFFVFLEYPESLDVNRTTTWSAYRAQGWCFTDSRLYLCFLHSSFCSTA